MRIRKNEICYNVLRWLWKGVEENWHYISSRFSLQDCSQHKGTTTSLTKINSNACNSWVLVVVMETNARLASSSEQLGWFVPSLGCWFYSVRMY